MNFEFDKNIETYETSMSKSNTEVSDLLNNHNIFVDNFRYIDYDVKSVILKSTIYDVKNVLQEKAKVRESFNIDRDNKIISVPNFFVKINGVLEEKKEHQKFIKYLEKNSAIFHDYR